MRMIFTHDIADDARRFLIGLVRREAVLMHRIEDTPVHRLQPVAHIRQCARHDHAHRVIEIALLHLVFDGDGGDFTRIAGGGRIVVVVIGHGKPDWMGRFMNRPKGPGRPRFGNDSSGGAY